MGGIACFSVAKIGRREGEISVWRGCWGRISRRRRNVINSWTIMKLNKLTISRKISGPDGYSIHEKVTTMTDFDGEVLSEKSFVKYSIMNPVDDRKFSVVETIERAIHLTAQLVNFWNNADGWAPQEAVDLLSRSRLDRQLSLTKQLKVFVDPANKESGYLILAWAALGSLTEGLLKLFLSIHYKTYQVHTLVDEVARIVRERGGDIGDPDGLMFEKLRQFFERKVFPTNAKEIWKNNGEMNWLEWLGKVQARRNAIHAFKDREIGTIEEFHVELQNFLIFARKIAYALPYPDQAYEPLESPEDGEFSEIGFETSDGWIRGRIEKGKIKVQTQADGECIKNALNRNEVIQVLAPEEIPPEWL